MTFSDTPGSSKEQRIHIIFELIQHSKGLLIAASVACVVHGVVSVLMVAQINKVLFASASEQGGMLWSFAGLALSMLVSQSIGSLLFVRLRHSVLAQIRESVATKVMATSYRHLETLGAARVHSALSKQCGDVAAFLLNVPAMISNAAVVVGCFVYMGTLSVTLLMVAALVFGLGSWGYAIAQTHAVKHVRLAAQLQDRLFEHFTAMTGGAKELRLNHGKSQRFWNTLLLPAIHRLRREGTLAGTIFTMAFSWGNFLIYAFIGLVIFWVVGDVPDRVQLLSGFALTVVFMVTPLDMLLSTLPEVNVAMAAARQIGEVTNSLKQEPSQGEIAPDVAFQGLNLNGVTHSYFHEPSESHFSLGPIDLTFKAGEVVFLVGGNGSGKTTLAKLLVGLYTPEQGSISFNGVLVDEHNRQSYRETFSTVFSDFYLFEQLLETEGRSLDEEGNRLLEAFQLSHKVRIENGAFSTRDLFQGQRKRLALVVAVLEDRPFFVFDEWAADQDPAFKDVFYLQILPQLKQRNKTVLVISHDDRYFHVADRTLHLESGQLSPRPVHAM